MSDCRLSSTKSSPSRGGAGGGGGGNSITLSPSKQNEEKSFSSMSSIYGKNSGVEIKTCAAIQELVSIRIPTHCDNWWCILVNLFIY